MSKLELLCYSVYQLNDSIKQILIERQT